MEEDQPEGSAPRTMSPLAKSTLVTLEEGEEGESFEDINRKRNRDSDVGTDSFKKQKADDGGEYHEEDE